MIAASSTAAEVQIPRKLRPFALRTDTRMPLTARVSAVVYVPAMEQAFVLTMGRDDHTQPRGFPHGARHKPFRPARRCHRP